MGKRKKHLIFSKNNIIRQNNLQSVTSKRLAFSRNTAGLIETRSEINRKFVKTINTHVFNFKRRDTCIR